MGGKMNCPRCRTDFEERCPVCEGSEEEFFQALATTAGMFPADARRMIAARDAAIREKALEEAAKKADAYAEWSSDNYTKIAAAIRALKNKEEKGD